MSPAATTESNHPAVPALPSPLPGPARPRVLIIGCGFGGLEAARALRGAALDITLVDRSNHHLFQPLLYQVATAGLSSTAIAAPVRHLFRDQANVTTLLGDVVGFDAQARTVRLADGATLAWDHCIVAAGATHSYFGNDAWAAFAPGLKTLDDAFTIRRRVLLAFEAAERESNPARRTAWLTFVVIGGGPTGVEMAGTLAEIARHTLAGEFRRIDPASARVVLVEGGRRVLQAMPEVLSDKAHQQLTRLGVEVVLDTRVTGIDAAGVSAKSAPSADEISADSYRIDSKCVIWAAGVAASPLGRLVAEATGVEADRSGRVPVAPDLSVKGHPHISVIGDLAAAQSYHREHPPRPVPGVSPAAKQMGRTAARNLLRRVAGTPTRAFRYRDYGNLATIGRNSAVVDVATGIGPMRLSGLPAWLFWLLAHIYFLIGFRNRMIVFIEWSWAYFSFERNARVVADLAPVEAADARDLPA